MAIAEDASTPAIATATGFATITSAAFSPPANTLLIALFGGGKSSNVSATASITDSVSGSWTTVGTESVQLGVAAIWYRYLSSAPGSMTVSISNTLLTGGELLAVRVLTGANSSQTGAGQTLTSVSATTSFTASITTTTANSQVYGVMNTGSLARTFTAAAATSIVDSQFTDSTDATAMVAIKATALTGTPGATTLGCTVGGKSAGNIAMFEVLPAVASSFIAPPPLVVQQVAFMTATY